MGSTSYVFINFINRQTEELFGYTRGDLVGQTLEVLVSERFRQGVRDYLRACIDDPTVATRRGVEVRALRRDSTDLPRIRSRQSVSGP